MLTFDVQDKVGSGGIANEALRGDTPQVDFGIRVQRETHSVSCHRDTAAGSQTALLQ